MYSNAKKHDIPDKLQLGYISPNATVAWASLTPQ